MERQRQVLDGTWQFVPDTESQLSYLDVCSIEHTRTIKVPMPWQAQFDDLHLSAGTGWYKRTFRVAENWQHQAIILHFGAVFFHAQVWLNGQFLGEDQNGYLPFEFDIHSHVRFNEDNELTVRATTPTDNPIQYPDYPFSEILQGKQSWYGHWGGIWQSVWVEARTPSHIEHVQLFPDMASNSVACDVALSQFREPLSLEAALTAPDGTNVAHERIELRDKLTHFNLELKKPALYWSPGSPHLYHLQLRLGADTVEKTCGFRTIETRNGQLILNGAPFYMRGALDQDYYPDTLSAPPSVEFLEDQFRKAKEMGLNTLRCHIKIPDPIYYEVADRLGMLLWVDLPSWQHLTEHVQRRVKETFERMLRRDGHHPAIAIWTIVNEDWGTDLVHNRAHRDWLHTAFDWLKTEDPTRLVVDNSACTPNFHLKSDIDDYHFYRAFPDQIKEWDSIIEAFAERAAFTYSPHGDAIRSYREPLIVSEFGTWGLPDPGRLRDASDREPWWFETGHNWAEGIAYPHGMEQRFEQWQLGRSFGSFEKLIEATQWQQFAGLKYQIESIRLQSAIQGYVITELTDLHWESNGLLDMRRNPRVFHENLASLNADALIIPRSQQSACYPGDRVCIQLALANTQPGNIRTIRWYPDGANQHASIAVDAENQDKVQHLHDIEWVAPHVIHPTLLVINFEALDALGSVVHHNQIEIAVLPHTHSDCAVSTDNALLAEQLRSLGYSIQSSSSFWITNSISADFQEHIYAGGHGLVLADLHSGLPLYQSGVAIQQQFPYLSISPREGTIWQGDWVSSFNWLHPHILSLDAPHQPLMGMPHEAILPNNVLLGSSLDDFHQAVLAGMFVGWVHRPAATLVQRRLGRGLATISTLNLLEPAIEDHPIARHILDRILDAPV